MRITSFLVMFFCASALVAQPSQPPLKILDEGVQQGTSVRELNCSGAGISCTYSNGRGTLSVAGGAPGGGATQLDELSDVNTSTPTNRNVLVADGVDWESRALTEADISDLTHTTDTNANTICSGSTTYLDGEGNCDDISSVYEPAGITESDISDLDHTATAITDGLIVEADLNEDSGTPTDEDVLTYDSTGANFNWIAQSSIAAGTAAALAANGANCSAGSYPLGVDEEGAVESCTADDDVPESGDFGAGVDLEADGSISANAVALTTDTTGNYVSSATANQGLLMTGTEGASLGLIDCAAAEILKRNAGDTAWECAADDGGSGSGDNVTVNGSAVDTTADFLDGDIDFTLTDGGGGGPDDITATLDATYEASLNVATAAALAANGGNCGANQYPLGVDAAGAVESCTADDDSPDNDGEVPDALTIAGGTIGTSAITLSTTTSTASGRIAYDASTDRIIVGDGTTTDEFYSGDHIAIGMIDNTLVEPDLNADNAANDGDILTYDSTGTNFAWITPNAGTDVTADLEEEAHCSEHSSTDLTCVGETLIVVDDSHAHTSSTISGLDVSADTNLAVTSPVVLTDDTLSILADGITHSHMADADQADSKCIYIENPVAADDLKSVWRNGTANDFQVTSIWAESDQTVTFMLQLDDGSPADCDTVDLAPAAGTAEDTSLNGDCLVSAGERLDIDVASVASTPTRVTICFTGNWVD